MARQRTAHRSSKSIAGVALVGFGMFILYENLAGAVAWLSHVLAANSSETLGVLPAVILAVSQVLQAHAANHQRLLQRFLQHMLISSWPLLLVMVGAVLSRDTFTDTANARPEKDCGLCRSDNRSLDVKVEAGFLKTQKGHNNAIHGDSQG
jgi:hypothetical protein